MTKDALMVSVETAGGVSAMWFDDKEQLAKAADRLTEQKWIAARHEMPPVWYDDQRNLRTVLQFGSGWFSVPVVSLSGEARRVVRWLAANEEATIATLSDCPLYGMYRDNEVPVVLSALNLKIARYQLKIEAGADGLYRLAKVWDDDTDADREAVAVRH